MDSVIDLTASDDDRSLSEDRGTVPDNCKVHASRPRGGDTPTSDVDSDDEFMKSLSPVAFPKSDRKDMNSARKQPSEANEPRSTATLAALKSNPMVSSSQKPSRNDDSSEDSDDVSTGYESPDADIKLPEIPLRVGDEIIYRCRTDIYLWKKRKIQSIDLNNRRYCLTLYGDYPLEKTHMVRLPWMDKSRRVEEFKLIEGVGPPPPESELARRFRLARGEVEEAVDNFWLSSSP